VLLAGLFAPRVLIAILTAASATDLFVVAELCRDRQILISAPFLGAALLVGGALAFLFTTLFRSALAVVREEATQSATLREQLLHSQKMEAIGRLAGGIAHDFNNILAVISGQTELHLLDPTLPAQLEAPVVEMKRYVAKATSLIRELLILSRREAVAASEPFDARVALEGLEKMLTRIIGSDVNLSISTAGDTLIIPGEQGKFEQVVMNLVVNARDAMPHWGAPWTSPSGQSS
jgi:signal transduction histidine kinase